MMINREDREIVTIIVLLHTLSGKPNPVKQMYDDNPCH